jgi:pyruvate dehydrogenase E2 component (dihydrolipoamide acetyltransferase)
MATKVMMEALSPTMEEGRLVKWVKNVGDVVKNGDTLAEVETDKAIMELVARGDGILRARLIEEGATSPVGVTIGVIAAADEDISALAGGTPAVAPTEAPSEQPQAVPASAMPAPPVEAREHAHPPAGTAEHTPAPVPGGPGRSSPLARRIAAELGWKPAQTFETGIRETVRWYLDHAQWVADVVSGDYRSWVSRNYAAR